MANNDFNMKIGVTADVDRKKIQAEIDKQTNKIDVNVNVKVDKTEAQKAVQNVFDKNKLDKQGREYFTKSTGILKQVKDYYKKNGAVSIDITNQQKANGQIKSFTATITEATGVIKKFNYERAKINTGGKKPNYGFVQTDNVTVMDKLSGSKLKQTDDFLSKIQNRISDINSKSFNQSKPLLSTENSTKYNTLLTDTQNKINAIKNSTKILSDEHKREIGTMVGDLDRYRKELQNLEYSGTKLKPDTFIDSKSLLQSQLNTNIQKWGSSNIFDGNFRANVLDAKNLLDNATNPEGLDKYRAKLKLIDEDFKQLGLSAKNIKTNFNLDEGKTQLNNRISSYLRDNTKLGKGLRNELSTIQSQIGKVDKAGLDRLNKSFRTVTSSAEALGETGNTVFTKLGKNAQNFLNFLGSATVVMTGLNAIRGTVSTVYELDETLTNLRMVTGGSVDQTQELVNSYNQLGQELGATTLEVTTSANEFLRQGKTIAETETLIKDAMVLSKVAQLDTASSTQYLTSTMLGYKIATQDVLGVIDMLTSVDVEAAVSAGGIAEALSRTASSAQLAGVSIEKLISYLTVVGEVSQKEMSTVGESFKTIFARMGNVKLGQFIDEDGNDITKDLSDAEKILGKVGIALRDSKDSFRDFDGVLEDVGNNWDKFSEVEQNALASTLAGVRQRENFLILMSNFDKSLKYTETALNSNGKAMEKFSYFEESAQAKANKLKSSLDELAMDTLDSGLIKGFLDLSNILIKTTDNIGLFNIAILLTSGILGGKGLGIMLPSLAMKLGGVASAFGASATAAGVFGAVLSNLVPILAIMATIKLYDELNVSLEEQREITAKLNSEYGEIETKLSDINSELLTTVDRINELNSKDSLTFVEQQELDNLKETNNQLESQNRLLNEQSEIKNREIANSVLEEFQKDMTSNSNEKTYWTGNTKQYSARGEVVTGNEYNTSSEEDYIKNMVMLFEKYNEKKEKGISLSKEEQIQYDQIRKDLVDTAVKYNDYADKYKLDDETSRSWRDFATLIDKTLNPAEYKQVEFDKIFNSDDFASAKSELLELASAGELTDKTITSNEKYNKILIATGLSAPEVVQQIKALAIETEDAGSSANEAAISVTDLTKALSAMSDSNTSLTDLKAEIKEFGSISLDTINGLIEKYPQLTDLLYDYLAGMASTKDVVNAMSDVYQTDSDNWASLLLTKYQNNEEFINKVGGNNAELTNKMKEMYGIDLSNDTTYYEKKMDILNTFLSGATKNWEKYYNIDTGKLQNMDSEDLTDAERAALSQEAVKANNARSTYYEGLDFSGVTANFETANTDFTKNNKDNGKDKDPKWLTDYNTTKADYDHQLAMDKINEEEYYDKLEKLSGDVYKNHKKDFLETYRQNQEAIYNGREKLEQEAIDKAKKNRDDSIKSLFDTNDFDYAMGNKSEEAYYNDKMEYADLYYKNDAEHLEDYRTVLEEYYKWQQEQAEETANKQEEIADRLKEKYSDLISDIADEVEKEKDTIIDGLEKSHEAIIDSLEKEKENYKEIVETQLDLLDAKKKQADYEKSIADKSKEISKIESRKTELQKAAKSGDRNAIAELSKLDEELAEKKDDLLEEQNDHELDLQKESLNNALDLNDKLLDARIDSENSKYETQKENIESLYNREIELINKATQYTKTEFGKVLDEIAVGLSSNGVSQSSDYLNSIKNTQSAIAGTESNTSTSNRSAILSILKNGTGKDYGDEASALNSYVRDTYGSPISNAQAAQIASLLNVSGVNSASDIKGNDANKNKILEALKKASFSKGGYASGSLSNLIKQTGEDGISLLKRGEPVLTVEQGKLFKELVGNLQPLNNLVKLNTPNVSNLVTNNNSSPIINVPITINGSADSSTVSALNNSANNIVKQIMDKVRTS